MEKSVFVSGATGFVGRYITRRLLTQGYRVRALVRSPAKARSVLPHHHPNLSVISGDVRDGHKLEGLIRGAGAVVHTVAIKLERGSARYEAINLGGTRAIANAARAGGVGRFINLSQNGASLDSDHPFPRTKAEAQAYIRSTNLDWTSLRPSAVFGPEDELLTNFARLAKLLPGLYPLVARGKPLLQPVHVEDVAEAALRCLEEPRTIGRELSLGGPEILSVEQIERRVLAAIGARRLLIPVGVDPLERAMRFLEGFFFNPPVTASLLHMLRQPNVVLQNALTADLAIEPRAAAGKELNYLRAVTASEAARFFLTGGR